MPHEEIYKELAECHTSGEFVAYHSWGDDPGIFLVGVVEELTPTRAVFREVDTYGQSESVRHTVALRLIHWVDRGTHYLERLKTLQDLGPVEPVDERSATSSSEILTILRDAARDEHVVRVWTASQEASDYFVISVGDRTVALANVVDGDRRDGRSVVRLNRIVRVRVGRSEIDATRVHQHWQKTKWNPEELSS